MNPQNGESWTGPAALGFADRDTSSVHSCPGPAHRSCSLAQRPLEELLLSQPRARVLCQQNLQVILCSSRPAETDGPGGRGRALRAASRDCSCEAGTPHQGFRASGLLAGPLAHPLASWLCSSGWRLPPGMLAPEGPPSCSHSIRRQCIWFGP